MPGYLRRKLRALPGVLAATVQAGLLLAAALAASAQSNAPQHSLSRADQEQASCIANLQTIYKAIQAYEHDHGALPNWLSDLVPKYLPDTNTLICPVSRRTGQTETPPLADPKRACSYLFEFCPVPLGAELPNAPQRTRREWKQRQMGLVGSIVPLVRCRQHASVLNLAFDGRIYESPPSWEVLATNLVNPAQLTPAGMFADALAPAVKATQTPPAAPRFPSRDPQAGPALLDLTKDYNAGLKDSWHGGTDNTLAALPEGLQTFGGVPFDVRGIVQLRSRSPASVKFPVSVTAIPVHQKCRALNFLHAAAFGTPTDEGQQIGVYVVHFATSQMRLEIPIRYGQEVRDWHALPGDRPAPKELQEVWRGQNPTSKREGHSIRLFLSSWTNVAPDLEIESLDYVSRMATPAPFLIAITVDSYRAPKDIAASFFHGPWVIVGLVSGGMLLLLAWIITRRPGRAKPRRPKLLAPAQGSGAGTAASFTLVMGAQPVTGAARPAARAMSAPQPLIQLEAPGVTHTEAEMLRVRAQAAADQTAHANAAIRRGIAAHLSRWLKQKLLRKLVADRAELLQAQQAAAVKALTMEDRLARVERQVQQQNQGYQRRIEELTRDLLVAKEENRELIRAQIRQVQAEMEAARARALARAKADEGE
jgi:hypothetical protein